MKRKCEICQIRDASLALKERAGEEIRERYMCRHCATARGLAPSAGVDAAPAGTAAGLNAQMFLKRLEQGAGRRRVRCPDCRSSYAEIRRRGLLGCAQCYETFETEVAELLHKIHGAGRHRGRGPKKMGSGRTADGGTGKSGRSKGEAGAVDPVVALRDARDAELRKLRGRLRAAVAREDFELAAQLRDAIQAAESRNT